MYTVFLVLEHYFILIFCLWQVTEPICKEKLLLCSEFDKCCILGSKINILKLSLNFFIRFLSLFWNSKLFLLYFLLFLKVKCVSWLFRAKYFEMKFNLTCFIFPLFHEHCHLSYHTQPTFFERLVLKNKHRRLSSWVKHERKWTNKPSSNEDEHRDTNLLLKFRRICR